MVKIAQEVTNRKKIVILRDALWMECGLNGLTGEGVPVPVEEVRGTELERVKEPFMEDRNVLGTQASRTRVGPSLVSLRVLG